MQGNNVTWTLDSDGVLTISGTGDMADYPHGDPPWGFYYSSIKSVVIENGVTSIGIAAFISCDSLTSINIPNSVSSIGDVAFSGTSLTSISIPNSVSSIGARAFAGSIFLTSINIPSSVSSIEEGAFWDCDSLTHIYVDANNINYKDIDGILFSKDGTTLISYPKGKQDTAYTIPNSVSSITYGAFATCQSLTSISIPNSVSSIGEGAFLRCDSLTSITIPNSVSSIGVEAFCCCPSLTSITIPNSVTSIDEYAFYECYSLKEVTILTKTASFADNIFYGFLDDIVNDYPSDIVIKGYSGSTAQIYANDNNHPFVEITSPPTPKPITSIPSGGYSGVLIGTGSNLDIIGGPLIRVELPTDTSIMNFILDPANLLSKLDSDLNIDPNTALLFSNKDDDGDITGMSGRSDPIKFTNKGRMPVNAQFTVRPAPSFNETDSTVNLVEKRSYLDGTRANIYLAANLPEWEDIPVGSAGGAVINALIPDSRRNYSINHLGSLKFEYEEIGDDWNSLELYFTGEADVRYTKWDDTVDPSKLSNAKYTAVWELTAVPSAPSMLDTSKGSAKNITVPLKGADPKATKKIYIKPLVGTLAGREDIMADAKGFAAEDIGDFIKIKKDNIVLNDNFAQYCKGRWGTCRVLIYAPGTQGVIAAVR